MSLSITPAIQTFATQLRVASDAKASAGTTNESASSTGDSPRLQAGGTAPSVKSDKSSGSSGGSSTTVEQLQKRLKELQKQLQQEQRELAEAQKRHYSSDAERTAALMALQSRIASTSAAMQQTAAALAEAIRKAGGSGAGSMLSASA